MSGQVFVVFKKEIVEMMRDKRVRRTALLMPGIMVFFIQWMFGFVDAAVKHSQNAPIYVVRTSNPLLAEMRLLHLNTRIVDSVQVGESLIRSGKAKLLVQFQTPKSYGPIVQQRLRVFFDPTEDQSAILKQQFATAMQGAMKQNIVQELKAQHLPPQAADPVKIKNVPIQVGHGNAGTVAAMILPYFIVLFAFTAPLPFASDTVAGEKERNTLETLLVSPVERTHLLLGKFLGLCTLSIAGTCSALIGLVAFGLISKSGGIMQHGHHVSAGAAGLILILLLPMICAFAGLMLAASSYAKNMREAQGYLGILNLFVILPAVFSQFIGLTNMSSHLSTYALPILGTATAMQQTLRGKPDFAAIAVSFASSLLIAALTFALARRMFSKESILVRS